MSLRQSTIAYIADKIDSLEKLAVIFGQTEQEIADLNLWIDLHIILSKIEENDLLC